MRVTRIDILTLRMRLKATGLLAMLSDKERREIAEVEKKFIRPGIIYGPCTVSPLIVRMLSLTESKLDSRQNGILFLSAVFQDKWLRAKEDLLAGEFEWCAETEGLITDNGAVSMALSNTKVSPETWSNAMVLRGFRTNPDLFKVIAIVPSSPWCLKPITVQSIVGRARWRATSPVGSIRKLDVYGYADKLFYCNEDGTVKAVDTKENFTLGSASADEPWDVFIHVCSNDVYNVPDQTLTPRVLYIKR